ncbi:hypothetical protein [Falsiroseomonas stagni]|uniref:Uncharacterized protein n=1 Tax=Falsiroseomonas stagni DSM 19981 TaxID=1123062 RepID=A0A1I4E0R0_9PROT|nr:hypothetical protein [Falsiroseomonas stagni]SFK99408.1 hypothetical protein SAMN02745775_113123 [Falsiroseomonas stagni DSM 19981]
MSANTTRTPLTRWSREVAKATVLTYRRAKGGGAEEQEAQQATRAAYLAAGGDPAEAGTSIPEIIGAAARDHGEWFWRPLAERLEREERWLKHCGIWPPPYNRALWPPMPDDFR